ncbi:transposase, MuDR, MULE transposase domain protein [Tanacetum coccineum]
MVCSLPHTDYEFEALFQKLIDEDKVRQNMILDLALHFENACTAKDDLRKAYENCNDIPQESRTLINTFLKECSILCCSSSQVDLYLTEKDLHQLHLDEEALRETLEGKTMDEKAREEKIRQKQADDDEFFMKFGEVKYDQNTKSNFNNENDLWEFSLDIDDSDLHLTPVLCSSSSISVEPSPSTSNPVRIIRGPAGIVQLSSSTRVTPSPSTPNPVSATEYVNANGGIVIGCLGDIDNNLKKEKLDQVVAIVKSCSPNVLGNLIVTMKDLSSTIPEPIHYKVIGEGAYGKDITVGGAMILANVSVFSPKPLMHYLNITKRNMVKVFHKDTVPESGSEGFLTEKEQQQLAQDEEAYREYLEE